LIDILAFTMIIKMKRAKKESLFNPKQKK